MVKLLSERAPAKLNLFLRVTGRRPDGYHLLDSVFVPISLYDQLGLGVRQSAAPEVLLRCDEPGLGPDDRNLAVRAAREFMAEFSIAAEVMIDLRKQIPVGAGLGGGSSDAGAVLRMLAHLYRSSDRTRMIDLALRLGADVPFFLAPAAAHVRGIGETINLLPRFPSLEMVVAVPPINVSTAEIFGLLRALDWSGPAPAEAISGLVAGRFDCDWLTNDLEAVAMVRWPIIAELKSALEDLGAAGAAMSGSGGAVFGVFRGPDEAARAAQSLSNGPIAAKVFTVTTLNSI
jgi:4-diphosphocytidyl-2-C-methyl-D-erythritol kinase